MKNYRKYEDIRILELVDSKQTSSQNHKSSPLLYDVKFSLTEMIPIGWKDFFYDNWMDFFSSEDDVDIIWENKIVIFSRVSLDDIDYYIDCFNRTAKAADEDFHNWKLGNN